MSYTWLYCRHRGGVLTIMPNLNGALVTGSHHGKSMSVALPFSVYEARHEPGAAGGSTVPARDCDVAATTSTGDQMWSRLSTPYTE
jgi:hypothetical protein